MSIVHPFDLDGPATFVRVQSKCRECQDALVRQHEGLQGQSRGDVSYEDLLQAGRIGLWQAVLHFDPDRGVAFSTYAGVAIQRHRSSLSSRQRNSWNWLRGRHCGHCNFVLQPASLRRRTLKVPF